ncbi:uncharacterized protein DUF4331 [Tahibacter aquaticus]|uniref:Uncharacterized protein DUF4331 n=1 Tax=Tahibacter aquaticus TaxID=520092 RepID=A0A4R6YXZ5_9GAMM|nr:DUF4331 domain-containing protein [Tahibacter aquaticus]TDR43874.1 uncharacterized protein DUF4331 [Tahibacter aquaticus]
MKQHPALRSTTLALAIAATAGLGAVTPMAHASSHREAPTITQYPKMDGTDLYVFRSYEPGRSDFVTIIANYVPLQDAYGGPNYFTMDPDGIYEIHIDNNGDAREDLTYRFKFRYEQKNIALQIGDKAVAIPLRNAGQINAMDSSARNDAELFTVSQISGPRTPTAVGSLLRNAADNATEFAKPVDNIGNKSIPDYAAYAASHKYAITIPNCAIPGRLFVGQRREGFGVNLGEIFDLVNIPVGRVIGSRSGGTNATAGKNVTSLALELPIACVTNGDPVIGAWTSASLPRSRLVSSDPLAQAIVNSNMVQVSRLGMPLVNEIVIGLKDKDTFNASSPKDDAQFATYVTNPTLPALLEILFGAAGVQAPPVFPRGDLVAAFLTGVTGVNRQLNGVPAEMIRLNTALPATAKGQQNSLGAAACFVDGALTLSNPGCDPAGFPNGRRPGDDVVDIELRVAMGVLLPPGPGKPASAALPYTDGVLVEDSLFDNAFPYLTTPLAGSPNGGNGLPANPATP